MGFVFTAEHQERSDALARAAVRFREIAAEVSKLSLILDNSAEVCECCSTTRYRNFPQRQLRARVDGAAERLTEIADTLQRRSRDPEFLEWPAARMADGKK